MHYLWGSSPQTLARFFIKNGAKNFNREVSVKAEVQQKKYHKALCLFLRIFPKREKYAFDESLISETESCFATLGFVIPNL